MITEPQIDEIVQREAIRHLNKKAIDGVQSRAALDSEGRDAIRITIRLKPKTAKTLEGDAVLDALVAIKSALANAGEARPSIVEYEEAGELVEGDDADTKS